VQLHHDLTIISIQAILFRVMVWATPRMPKMGKLAKKGQIRAKKSLL
jgi:hypothetical protein